MKKVDFVEAVPYAKVVRGEGIGGPTVLDWIYKNEKLLKNHPFLHQPYGRNKVKTTTYGNAVLEARKMATYLKSQGMQDGDHIGILSSNCDKCVIAEMAIWMAGCTTVSVYVTSNASTVAHCLQSTDVKFLFVGKIPLYEAIEPGLTDIPTVAFPLAPQKAKASFESWEDIIRRSSPLKGKQLRFRNDLAMILFTQGTTGKAKAVMHAFGPVLEVTNGIMSAHKGVFNKMTRMLCLLPLAYAFARSHIELTSLVAGCQLYFMESPSTFQADNQNAAATVYIAPSTIFISMCNAVESKFPSEKLDKLLKVPMLGKLVKKKISMGLGLNMAGLVLCVSDTLPERTLAWFKKIGLNIFQCYGTTEDLGYSHCARKNRMKPLYSGVPYPQVRVKIDHETSEVLIDSPGKFVGYYNAPETTRQCMDSDGFFCSGDCVDRSGDGMIRLQGRTTSIFKTKNGKYVAPELVEQILSSSPIVEKVCVSGHGLPQPFAQVVLPGKISNKLFEARPYAVAQAIEVDIQLDTKGMPTEYAQPKTAVEATVVYEERNFRNTSSSREQVSLKENTERLMGELLDVVNAQTEQHEQLGFIVIISDPWTSENGCLTPIGNIVRSAIQERAADRIEGWFSQRKKIIWA